MNIQELPNELLEKIFFNLIPGDDCDIEEFKNYFLVNWRWYHIINSFSFRCLYAKSLNIYSFFKKKYNSSFILSRIFNYSALINIDCYNKILLKFNPELINIIGYDNLVNLPVCKLTCSKCINNMCHKECYIDNQKYIKNRSSNLMRGIDDLGRVYILVIYKDLSINKIYYEFIYHETLGREEFVTYSGLMNKTFIGMLSDNRIFTDPVFSRELQLRSYDYLNRLIKNNYCGVPKYDPEKDNFYESNSGFVTIYF